MAVRSFVVRALLETPVGGEPRWHGQVTDVATGARRAWAGISDVGRFIEARLLAHDTAAASVARIGGLMAAPSMNDVVTDMLDLLDARLPDPNPPLPEPNVTLERVRERQVGLGGHRGTETTSPIGPQALRGGRLDARVRFQLWASTPDDVDSDVVSLHGTMLEQQSQLRVEGFLKVAAAETAVSEHVAAVNGWRKTTSYDVLYEFQYRDSDDADSLIARIPVNTDPEEADSPDRETETITDDMVRWDEEGAAPLAVTGPADVARLDLLRFVAGPAPGGTVTLLRTFDGAAGPPATHPDIPTFVAAVAGDAPSEVHAEVTLSTTDFVNALAAIGDPIELGDWDDDGTPDVYDGFRLAIEPAIHLPEPTHRFELVHSNPGGLDQQAVIYARVNAP